MELDERESATGVLHRLTSYIPERSWDEPVDDPRVRQDVVSCDPARRTPTVKSYGSELKRTALPRDLPVCGATALAVLSGVSTAAAPVDLAGLSRLLFLSAGVVQTAEREEGTMLYRAAGSAGNRFPLDLYVAIPEGAGADLPAGVLTFLDSDLPAFLGDPDGPHGLIFTCVGVPGNTSKPAGRPGAPTLIRPVRPRE